jgi:hypothetical protein
VSSGWHRKRHDAAAQQRKAQYNSTAHRRLRAELQALVDSGAAACWRCRRPIPPGSRWHVGHSDTDRTVYMGPEHPSCNLKAAASKGARIANARRKIQREGGRASVWTW